MHNDLVTLEAALYVAGRPLSLQEMADIIGKAESTTKQLIEDLEFKYQERGGALEIAELPNNRYVLQLRPELTSRVGKLIPGGLLSFGTLQTLIYIALKQPILQSDLVFQRGTHVYDHVKELEDKKFISSTPEGRSKVLTTTPLFSDYFGLDADVIRMKAELSFKMRKIRDGRGDTEGGSAAASD